MDIVNKLTEAQVAYWSEQKGEPIVMKAPPGMVDCSDCAAVLTDSNGERVVRVAWKPNEIDLVHLAKGGTIWLSCWGGLPPHMVEVQAP